MTENAEQNGPQLEIANDPRLTKVGKVLRKHHLDELPQLFNVLIGEMSLVGYRPERKFFIDQIMEKDARYECLYQMRPGLTSEATLYNGYTNSVEKMLERLNMDLRYLEMGSIRTDIKIILSTIKLIVLGGKTL
jgi:lipopolysaccharide/colanic/teichoic acid biosynthesis glycosyltransferase